MVLGRGGDVADAERAGEYGAMKPPPTLVYPCSECERHTTFSLQAVHTRPDEGPPEEYSFAVCGECSDAAVFYREDMGDGFETDAYRRVYPPHHRHVGYALPPTVRASYEEAVRCEASKVYTACVVMVGRTLEAVCKEHDPSVRSIFKGLKMLHQDGLISEELMEWADQLRVLRNIGAHASDRMASDQDAEDSLDFLQAILEVMYDLRPRFQSFKARSPA